MLSTERERFDVLLAELFGALDKPLTDAKREGFWTGLAKMSLTEFARCRDALMAKLEDGEAPRNFSVADVWAAKRALRAPLPVYVHQQTGEVMDHWTVRANRLLLAYLMRRLTTDSRAYGPVRRCSPGETCYSPEQEAAAHVLIGYKNAWADDMREEGTPTTERQRDTWNDCMRRAEADIAIKVAA